MKLMLFPILLFSADQCRVTFVELRNWINTSEDDS